MKLVTFFLKQERREREVKPEIANTQARQTSSHNRHIQDITLAGIHKGHELHIHQEIKYQLPIFYEIL